MHSEEADAMIDSLTERITLLEQLLLTCYDRNEFLEINSDICYLKSIRDQPDLGRPRLIFNGRDIGRNITGI